MCRPRTFSTKAKGAQEAHEAIRPTNLGVQNAGLDSAQKRLYDLIWKRTMASQMADAKLERTTAQLENAAGLRFVARGEMIAFDGFLKVYREGVDEEEEDTGLLPTLAKGDAVTLLQATAQQRFTRPPGRFTEATLVKALEELGIGRPSTYAPTITTVQKRGYIQKAPTKASNARSRWARLRMARGPGRSVRKKPVPTKAAWFPRIWATL